MALTIPAASGTGQGLEVAETVFGREFNETLVHQLVVAFQAAGRSGTKGQKTRSEVSGGGAKPWRQKGSGRARAGSSRSPIWRTGGVTFAAKNRSFVQKLNKKMYRAAMCSIFSELLRQDRLFVDDNLSPAEPKTKELVKILGSIGMDQGVIVIDGEQLNLTLAARNLPGIDIFQTSSLSPVALVNSDKVVLTREAAKKIEASLS